MRGYFTGIIGLMVVLLASFVSASYITIQTTAETNSTGGTITVTNNGDESAYKVQVISGILGDFYKSEIRTELKVGDVFTTKLPFSLSDKPVGIYPLTVKIQYQDVNGYLFSAILSKFIENNLPSRSEITVELNDAEITNSVKLPVKITNFGEKSKDVSIFLFTSDEFTVKSNNLNVSVPSKSHKEVVFNVENFSARSGSNYSFYAIVEYDEQDGHYSAIDSGEMKVFEKKSQLFDKKLILILLVLLALFFTFMQFKKKK